MHHLCPSTNWLNRRWSFVRRALKRVDIQNTKIFSVSRFKNGNFCSFYAAKAFDCQSKAAYTAKPHERLKKKPHPVTGRFLQQSGRKARCSGSSQARTTLYHRRTRRFWTAVRIDTPGVGGADSGSVRKREASGRGSQPTFSPNCHMQVSERPWKWAKEASEAARTQKP